MCCSKTQCNGCMIVAWVLCWGGSRSTKPCVFPSKVAAGGRERYLVCAAVAAAIVSGRIVSSFPSITTPVVITLRHHFPQSPTPSSSPFVITSLNHQPLRHPSSSPFVITSLNHHLRCLLLCDVCYVMNCWMYCCVM